MKAAIRRVDDAGVESWEAVAGDPRSVADLVAQGKAIGPLRASVGRSQQFFSADWLFVSLRRTATLIAGLLDHPFTARHAGVIWLADGGDAGSSTTACLIGLPLAVTIVDAAQYRAALAGLAAIYGEASARDALQSWCAANAGDTAVLSGSLDVEAVRQLEVLGRESHAHAGRETKGYLRSQVRLDPSLLITLADGDEAALLTLAEGTRVCCPVHLDLLGAAQILGGDHRKGVQCPVCRRNYWMASTLRSVDFGHFRRVFGELHAQEEATRPDPTARQFALLRTRFLPALRFKPGITLVRSPTGTGKTQSAVPLVEECRARGMSVLVIGHRRGLLRALATRLGLDLYFETLASDDDSTEYRAIAVTDSYAICLDSVPARLQPDLHKFDVIIVDEAEQVVRHLVGGTLKAKRRLAFKTFSHYVSAARAVYLLDAHLDELTLSFVTRSAKPAAGVRFIVNEPLVEPRQYELVASREAVLGRLGAAVATGKKCYLATNSKDRAIATGLWLKERWPERRIVVVTHKNAQTPDVQDLLCNLAEEFTTGRDGAAPLDVLIGSPAIGTGIDITFPGGGVGVDHVFGIFEAGITTHFDVDQQLGRVRNPGSVAVWICPKSLCYETAPDAVLSELKRTVARTDVLLDFNRDGQPIFYRGDLPLLELWSEIAATERASKNALRDNWMTLRERDGWSAVLGDTDDDDRARGTEAMAEGNRLHRAEHAQRIVNARDIDGEEGAVLDELNKKGVPLTEEQRDQLEKWHLRDFYDQEVDEALVAFDDGGRTRNKVEMLAILVGDPDMNRKIDGRQIDRKKDLRVIAFDRQFRCAKAEILGRLLVAAGLVDGATGLFNLDAVVCTDSLGAFATAYRADRRRIQSELGLDMRRDIDKKPVEQLGSVLRLIGASTVLAATAKTGGVKKRSYRIDADELVRMMDVVVRRAEKQREEWQARQEGEGGDNAPPDDLETIQQALSPGAGHGESADDSDVRDVDQLGRAQREAVAERLRQLKAAKISGQESGAKSPTPRMTIDNIPFSV